MLLQCIVPAPLVLHNQNINLYDVESWRLLNGLVFEIPWRAAQKLDSPVAGLGSVKQMAVALGDFVGYDKHGLSVVGLRNGSLSWAYKVLTFLRAHLKRLGRDPWQKGRNKKKMASPGLEPETFVLDWRDIQLHHETISLISIFQKYIY